MLQTILAFIVIAYFLGRLFWQKKQKSISEGEFRFWLAFWLLSGVLLLALKQLDKLAANLGFSASGIQLLLYAAVAALFYFIFRIRLRLERMEEDLTKVVTAVAKRH
ncbi:hypothetical protein COT94_01340 [Candidatus Falkowbacteria bacterium CG10_big_fil_rev_8_21_14_0_10_37_14]|uniref:DUF2304 domain-containing protein n=1 Tax=Candidatus Falkowbacteria bacterium CG10_big_fil_rev_8_21_14_0_10_37_14 TaxID=1974561 RepID=A0A2M6WU60_9BACT|nr:DUF2304 family protein [Candidatus Falkowbacteria bacterium]PIT96319.1 MAG: hypothetical protein COT94_01340 [Candidatus Falkowbacteria bacterium CG10_big_fil_rev_8_21_14_0_10_37_14]